MRKMTHEEYVERLKGIHSNIEVLDTFINTQTKILHRCNIHNYEWMIMPNNLLRGGNCPKCSGVYRKSHDEYAKELHDINPNIEVIGRYKNNKIKIKHRCVIHNYIWEVTPDNLLHGKNCPKCSGNYKRTHEDYVNELKEINSSLEVIGKFVGVDIKILHRCKIHDITFEKFPSSALKGSGCRKCGGDINASIFSKTHEEYVNDLKELNPDITVIETYVNAKTKLLHKCNIDNYEWYVAPDSTLQGNGCPMCGGRFQRTHDEYVEILKNKYPNLEVLETYINSQTKILHRCKIHNYEWRVYPNNIIRGHGCPMCASSKGEFKISKWLDEHNIFYEHQKRFDRCVDNRTLPFDFYIPDINTCIEFDGEQHFRPVNFGGCSGDRANQSYESTIKHDNIKNEYCKSHGINLIRIPYYKDIESELNLLFT